MNLGETQFSPSQDTTTQESRLAQNLSICRVIGTVKTLHHVCPHQTSLDRDSLQNIRQQTPSLNQRPRVLPGPSLKLSRTSVISPRSRVKTSSGAHEKTFAGVQTASPQPVSDQAHFHAVGRRQRHPSADAPHTPPETSGKKSYVWSSFQPLRLPVAKQNPHYVRRQERGGRASRDRSQKGRVSALRDP